MGRHLEKEIGGDDFVVIVRSHVSESYFEDIKKQFESKVAMLYDNNDINNGFILTKNRHGEEEKYPLMTLTIVVLSNNNQAFENVNELTEKLALLKKEAKIIAGTKPMA